MRAGFGRVVFVIRRDFEDSFKAQVLSRYEGRIDASYCFQDMDELPGGFTRPADRTKPWGTTHAILAARHASCYLAMARRLSARMRGEGGELAFRRLSLERENLLAACDNALAVVPATEALPAPVAPVPDFPVG